MLNVLAFSRLVTYSHACICMLNGNKKLEYCQIDWTKDRRISTRGTMNFVRRTGSFILFCKSMRNYERNFLDKKNYSAKMNQFTILRIPEGDLVNTGRRFGQYRKAIWPMPAKVQGVH